MRRLILLFLALLPVIASAQDPAPAKIDAVFSRFDHRDSPGCILAVTRAGKVVYEKAYGMADLEREVPITPASIFHVASISKQFTAMAVLLLEQQGKLSIDDDVHKYIPELPDYGKAITLRHLLGHTSGIRDQWTLLRIAGWREDDLITEDDVMWAVTHQRALNFSPGDEYLYSNSGFTLLAVIVHRVSGQTLRAFADEQIFKPLGMTHTHFHDDHTMVVPHRTSAYQPRTGGGWRVSIPVFDTYGATSLFTTAEDLMKWEQNFAEPRVGSAATLAKMQREGMLNDGTPSGYALGLAVGKHRGVREIGHSGADAGYRADVVRYPDQQLAVAALCNASNSNPGALTRQVADLYLGAALGPENAPARQAGTSLTPAQLAPNVGVYRRTSGDLMRLELRNGQLAVADGGPELVALSESRFAIPAIDAVVTVDAASGRPRELRLQQGTTRPVVYVQMTPFAPTADQLAAFAGAYRSAELDTDIRVTANDTTLVFVGRRPGSLVMRPVYKDAFRGGGLGVAEFSRDTSGRVTGFVLNTGRVRALRFDRLE